MPLFTKKPASDQPPEFPASELILNSDGSVYHLNLKPEHIADTIIAVGDPGRVHRVSDHFEEISFEMKYREFVTHTGFYKGKRLTVISTGMGTDNIEIFLNELDALVNIDLKSRTRKATPKTLNIIRLGTAGSLQEGLPIGSHLFSENAIGLDTLMSFYQLPQSEIELAVSQSLQETLSLPFLPYCASASPALKSILAPGLKLGNTVTCPGFYAPQGRKLRFELRYPDFVTQLSRFKAHDFWLANFEMETAGYYALSRILGHQMASVNAIIANRITNEFASNARQVIDALIVDVLEKLSTADLETAVQE